MADEGTYQIGEIAAQVGLSLRTVRYYEEVGLVVPSARTEGGFRLYTDVDVERLQIAKRLKALDFTLEELGEMLRAWDGARSGNLVAAEALAQFVALANERCGRLRAQVDAAEATVAQLWAEASLAARTQSSHGADHTLT